MTATDAPTLLWLRRDLRLADHAGWRAALGAGAPVIAVFILDPITERTWGAAALWRLGESLGALARSLEARGSRLILRRGAPLDALGLLCAETGARRVVWSRRYRPASAARDREVAAGLRAVAIEADTVDGFLLHEPWGVATAEGQPYRVFTPFWRAVRGRAVPEPVAAPRDLAPPAAWPASETLADWRLGRAMRRGAAVVARHAVIGEPAAEARLAAFVAQRIAGYAVERDRLDRGATSGLSENLAYGEISPRQVWNAALAAGERDPEAARGAEGFVRQLAWREFAWHLLHHAPQLETRAWRPGWDRFPWRGDNADAERWRRGLTGVPLVDAAMRQLYVTGTMHNRARMIVASFLTKHLLTHWTVGAEWFRDCLIDWDPASNALGWQWVAGSGPDAAPWFRVFNPEIQAARFDPDGRYRARFLAGDGARPTADARAFFDAAPRAWNLAPGAAEPAPVIGLAEGRARALAAWDRFQGKS
ncbi:MAG TPA: deoxyribodipyrimidine photo-lyase [Thermohalobaculum sp.]|nr:deoxyribodipyrimidine photo-lyase [Thermohalobaculum sp.]